MTSTTVVQPSTSEQLRQAMNDVRNLESRLGTLNDTLVQLQKILEEVIAENAEKQKIIDLILAFKSFDSSKIKNCCYVNPITDCLINQFEKYKEELFHLQRHNSDAQENVDKTIKEIASVKQQLEEARVKVQYLKCMLKREQEDIMNQLKVINDLLNEPEHPCASPDASTK